jgi:acyl-CoA synthetase (AMP-forming)/AMP-acid ligase II
MGAGGCFSGANPGYTARELAHHVRVTNAKFILTEPKMLDNAIAAAAECGVPREKIFLLNFKGEAVVASKSDGELNQWADLLSKGEKDWVEIQDASKPAAFVSTSGTSGLPKAAIIPHSYLVSQGEIQETLKSKTFKVSRSSRREEQY